MHINKKKKYKLIIFLISIVCLIPDQAWAILDAQKVNSGNKFYKKGKYDASIEKYRQALKNDPESDIINFNLGTAYYRQGMYDLAIEHLQKSVLTDNDLLRQKAFYNLGNGLYRAGEVVIGNNLATTIDFFTMALGEYEKALLLDKEDKDAQFNYEFVKKRLEQLKNQLQQNKESRKEDKQDKQQDQSKQPPSNQQNKNNQDSRNQENKNKEQENNDQQNKPDNQNGQNDQKDPSNEPNQPDQQGGNQNQDGQDQNSPPENDPNEQSGEDQTSQNDPQNQPGQPDNQGDSDNKDRSKKNKKNNDLSGQTGQQQGEPGELTDEEAQMLLQDYQQNFEQKSLLKFNVRSKQSPVLKDW
ncbi:MAG: tetratricopeptide repeat protein [Candidatus Omnitrophota bacterium]